MFPRLVAAAATALTLLSACGGSSDPRNGGTAGQTQGAAIKGPLQGATVKLYAVDAGGLGTGAPLAELTTDNDGRFTFERPASDAPLLAQTSGGSFVDESDPQTDPALRRRIALGPQQGFESILQTGANTLVITPYTQALLLRARRLANGANFLETFEAVAVRSTEAFGFDPLAVLPASPLNPARGASDSAYSYALLLGGAAQAINELSLSLGTLPSYATVRAFIEDFSDGNLNGQIDGRAVTISIGDGPAQPIPQNINLAAQILRFRNNHFEQYGSRLGAIDEVRLSQPIEIGNRAPLARADAYTTLMSTALSVAAPGVLVNDIDNDGDPFTASLLDGPSHGTLALAGNGSFVYTPAADFAGTDSFRYVARDGSADSAPGVVTISVTADPRFAPVAVADSLSVTEGGVAVALDGGASSVLANDTDPDSDPLTARLVAQPAHGLLTLQDDGRFEYTHDGSETTGDVFTYQASDGKSLSNIVAVAITITPVNDAPTAMADSFSVEAGVPLIVPAPGVLANDMDVEGEALTAVLVSGPASGVLTLNPDGSFTYTSNAGFNGQDRFSYRARDARANSNLAIVTIQVGAGNQSPLAVDDSFATRTNTALNIPAPGVLGNDTDPEGATLTATLVNGPSSGTLVLNLNGSFTYTPASDFTGIDGFRYEASDGVARSRTANVTLVVGDTNSAPIAVNDAFETPENTPLTIGTPGILANDSDPDGDALTLIPVSQPANGTLTLDGGGGFSYTPAAGFSGSDSFRYQLSDGVLVSNVATVTLTVLPASDAPVAADDIYTTNEATPLTVAAPGVLTNDVDPDGDTLSVVLVSPTTNGTLELAGSGGFTYTPAAGFAGSDSFRYRVNDGTLDSNIATVTLSVIALNSPPIAANDAYTTPEDTALTVTAATGVLRNDNDPDGDALSITLVGGAANGALSIGDDGGFTYVPNPGFSGSDTFRYQLNDGTSNSNIATVTLTVSPINDPPLAGNDAFDTPVNTALNIPAPGVLTNDSDAEGGVLAAELVTAPASGVLTLSRSGGFTFTPALDFSGSVQFTYRASDGVLRSEPATVTITVNSLNDPPVAANDSYTTAEATTLNVAAPGILTNDVDPEGAALTAVLVGNVGHGTLSLSANGSFVYTPATGFSGTDSFSYRARDGLINSFPATVTITVTGVDQPPVAVNDAYSTGQNAPLTIPAASGVLANDSDPNDDPLTAINFSPATSGSVVGNLNGSFTYTPAAGFVGTATFTYRASDGTPPSSNLATVTITVSGVDRPPVAVNDSYTTPEDTVLTVPSATGVLANDTDPDGDTLTAVMFGSATNGTVTPNPNAKGGFTFTPTAGFTGTATFKYSASDGSPPNSAPATVTITVTAVDHPPVAVADAYTTPEDTALTVPAASGVLANDSDPDGDPLTAVMFSAATNGSIAGSPSGGFKFTPTPGFSGTASFKYRASDGSAPTSNLATVTITVTAVDDPPVAVNDTYTTNQGVALTVNSTDGVLANDGDPDGDPLTAIAFGGAVNGSVVGNVNGKGGFTFTPAAGFVGTASFKYTASDGSAPNSAPATVTITITAVDRPPVAVNDAYTTDKGVALTVNSTDGVLANDTDPDGDPLTAILFTGAVNGTVMGNANGKGGFTFTPAAGFSGTASFKYSASDGSAPNSAPATVTITVVAVNKPPVAVNDAYTTAEGSTLTVTDTNGVLKNDTDPDGPKPTQAVLVSGVTAAQGTLTLTINGGGFTYMPKANFSGTATFTYMARDAQGLDSANVATVTITVTAVNKAPVAVDDSYTTVEDTNLSRTVANGVLANDTDADGPKPAIAVLVADVPSAAGTLEFPGDGSFTFTPKANVSGPTSFTYKAKDAQGLLSDIATVSINVTAANDPPVLSQNNGLTLDEGATATITNTLLKFTDADSLDTQIVYCVKNYSKNRIRIGGTAVIKFTQQQITDNVVKYAHDGSEETSDSFSGFVANIAKGGACPPPANKPPTAPNFTFDIKINPVDDSPVANDDGPFDVDEGGMLKTAPFALSDNDTPDSVSADDCDLVDLPNKGSVTLNTNGQCSFTYSPDASQEGPAMDSFTYKVTKGGEQSANAATVTIKILAVNDRPILATTNPTVTVDLVFGQSETEVTVEKADLESTDVDDMNNQIIYTVKNINPVSPGNANSLRLSGSPVNVNQTFTQDDINNNRLSYKDVAGMMGTDHISFTVEDQAGLMAMGGPFDLQFKIVPSAIKGPNPQSARAPRTSTLRLGALDTARGRSIRAGAEAVAGIGDFNGDGFGDVAFGGINQVKVIYGSAVGLPARLDRSALGAHAGFVVRAPGAAAEFGAAVSGAGDVDGDGYADLLIGSPLEGAAYLVFGGARSRPAQVDLVAPTRGFVRFSGDGKGDRFGAAVATGGDVNGDGFADMIIGSPLADPDGRIDAGRAQVLLGGPAKRMSRLAPMWLDGVRAGDHAGAAVAAGDVNGDGLTDVIVGSPLADPGGRNAAGSVHVVFGAIAGLAAHGSLTALNGANGFAIVGAAAGDGLGSSVAAGDINGDGLADVVIGAPLTNVGAGSVHVVFGSALTGPAHIAVGGAAHGGGLLLTGGAGGDNAGHAVAAGDIDGDGLDDLLIGAPGLRAGVGAGGAYLVYGGRALPARIALDRLAPAAGRRVLGVLVGDLAGSSLDAAADINSDGLDDLIIGAPGAGAAYLIFGRRPSAAEQR